MFFWCILSQRWKFWWLFFTTVTFMVLFSTDNSPVSLWVMLGCCLFSAVNYMIVFLAILILPAVCCTIMLYNSCDGDFFMVLLRLAGQIDDDSPCFTKEMLVILTITENIDSPSFWMKNSYPIKMQILLITPQKMTPFIIPLFD